MHPLTSALAHWQGIKLIAGVERTRKRGMDVPGRGKGSVDVKTMGRRRDTLMDAGCRSVAAGSSGFRRALCLWDLIAPMSLFEVLTVACLGGSQ